MRPGPFDIRIKFNGAKIVDQKVNTSEEMGNIFEDVKKKFK